MSRSMILENLDADELVEKIAAAVVERVRDILTEAQQPRLADRRQMAMLAGVSEPTLDRLVRAERVPSILVGSRRMFRPTAVIAALEAEASSPQNE